MTPHDLSQRHDIGRPAGGCVEDGRDLAEEVGAEDAGGDDCERPGVDLGPVGKVVDGTARDTERLAGVDVDRRPFDGPGEDSLQPVDRLLVVVMAVRGCDSGARRNVDSKTDTDPADSSPSTRKRIASSPTLISSRVLVDILRLLVHGW